MDIQSLAQLQALQNTNSYGTSSATASPTSDLFSQMLSQLTSSSSSSGATQMLGLTNALSNNNNASYLMQLLGSGVFSGSPSGFDQLLGDNSSSTATNYSQILNSLNNASGSANTNNSLYYNGSSPVYTPASVLKNYANSYNNVSSSTQAGPTSVSSNMNYDAIIKKAAATYDLPEKMIKSVIKQESGFNNHATSSAGAGGLMQLMPSTAKYLGVSNVYDAEQNIMGGTKYLKQLYNQFNGNFNLMLAAYNAGPGNVKKYGGIPPFKETQNYVNNIMSTYKA